LKMFTEAFQDTCKLAYKLTYFSQNLNKNRIRSAALSMHILKYSTV